MPEPKSAPSESCRQDEWEIPAPREFPRAKGRDFSERENVDRLEAILTRCGWSLNREVCVYGPQGKRFRCDLIARHPEIPGEVGALEVKSASTGGVVHMCPHYALSGVIKQAIDYVGTRILATGEDITWSAIYPVTGLYRSFGEQREERMLPLLGMIELASKHFKCHTMFHRPSHGLSLLYLDRHIMWDERYGFRKTAADQLCGKRQVGGQRR